MPSKKVASRKKNVAAKRSTNAHDNVSSGDLRRLAHAAGVHRMTRNARHELIDVLADHVLDAILKDAVTYMEHDKRKTISGEHIKQAFKRHGRHLHE
jgi:histone H3/H4